MRKALLITAIFAAGLLGCRRDSPARKLLDGAPAGSALIALPVDAVQAFHLLERQMLSVLVAVTKRTSTLNPTYPDVTAQGGGVYRFTTTNERYGQATFDFTFRDGSNTIIDPISSQSSTTSIKSIDIAATSGGFPFTSGVDANLTLTLDILGDVYSTMYLTGDYTLSGSTIAVTFTLAAPGGVSTFAGLAGGTLQIAGSDAAGSISGTVSVNTAHEYNGSLTWNGETGQVHVKDNGQAFVLLNNERYFFD